MNNARNGLLWLHDNHAAEAMTEDVIRCSVMSECGPLKFCVNFLTGRKLRYRTVKKYVFSDNWWPMEHDHPGCLIICQLQDSLGGVEHSVSIVNEWIFDGNFSRALPLNRSSLDMCCKLITKGDGVEDKDGKYPSLILGHRCVSIVCAWVLKRN